MQKVEAIRNENKNENDTPKPKAETNKKKEMIHKKKRKNERNETKRTEPNYVQTVRRKKYACDEPRRSEPKSLQLKRNQRNEIKQQQKRRPEGELPTNDAIYETAVTSFPAAPYTKNSTTTPVHKKNSTQRPYTKNSTVTPKEASARINSLLCNNASPSNTNNSHISRNTERTPKPGFTYIYVCVSPPCPLGWCGHVNILSSGE